MDTNLQTTEQNSTYLEMAGSVNMFTCNAVSKRMERNEHGINNYDIYLNARQL
jgi:hypothetical protein